MNGEEIGGTHRANEKEMHKMVSRKPRSEKATLKTKHSNEENIKNLRNARRLTPIPFTL
jgi:hypothetical protein